MPKGTPKKLEDISKQLEEILAGNLEIAKSVDSLGTRVKDLEENQIKPNTPLEQSPVPINVTQIGSTATTSPIPSDYRIAVNQILNQDFGIDIDYFTDLPQFGFTVIVPEQYSSLTPQEKVIKKVDLRTRIIKFAEGLNGVKEWSTKIFNTFPPELKAKITMERK